jgi:hypothetical protein
MIVILADDPHVSVSLAAQGVRRQSIEQFLEKRFLLAQANPELLASIVANECLRGLSMLNRSPGAEHTKATGRKAGGGRLVKGS